MSEQRTGPCPRCAAEIPLDSVYCQKCGSRVDGNPEPRTTAYNPPPPVPQMTEKKGGGCQSFLKKIGFTLLGLVSLLIIVGIIGSSQDGKSGSSLAPISPTAAPIKAKAVLIDPREITADPKSFKGRNVELVGQTGNVTQQDNYTWVFFLANVPGRTSESVVVEFRPKDPSILKQECYRVYGIVDDTQRTTLVFTGASNNSVTINAYAYEKLPTNQYGSCQTAPTPSPAKK